MLLVLAGNIHPIDQDYFLKEVAPYIDGELIQYVGEADSDYKRQLLAGAYCLLAPITWPEPFGLFMVEAMACGTPVVAFNHGAAPEVVQHGVTGYVVGTLEEMVNAVPQAHSIDPAVCREHVQQRFSIPRMADEYLTAYERIINLGPTLRVKAAFPMSLTRPIVVPTSASKRAEDLTDLETTPV
jgi:glycosyltransferase involved in cell wall biosynthesis